MPQTCESPRVVSLSSLHTSSSLKNGICFPLSSLQSTFYHHHYCVQFTTIFFLDVFHSFLNCLCTFSRASPPFSPASKHSDYPEFQIWQSINKILQRLPISSVQETKSQLFNTVHDSLVLWSLLNSPALCLLASLSHSMPQHLQTLAPWPYTMALVMSSLIFVQSGLYALNVFFFLPFSLRLTIADTWLSSRS